MFVNNLRYRPVIFRPKPVSRLPVPHRSNSSTGDDSLSRMTSKFKQYCSQITCSSRRGECHSDMTSVCDDTVYIDDYQSGSESRARTAELEATDNAGPCAVNRSPDQSKEGLPSMSEVVNVSNHPALTDGTLGTSRLFMHDVSCLL